MILQTIRLTLREMTREDLPALKNIMQDPEVMYAYEGAFTDEETQRWLERQLARYAKDGFGLWAVVRRDTGDMIGQCGLTMQPYGDGEVLEVGYLFAKAHWHMGYAAEAARACRDYAFERLDAPRVYSIIRDTNVASQHVAIRNGMTRRAEFIKHYRGVDMPHVLYCVENPRSFKRTIEKERIYLMCPCAYVCAAARLSRVVEEGALRAAIENAVRSHEILRAQVALDADGAARFEGLPSAREIRLQGFDCDPAQLIREQERVPFRPESGDMIRFFIREADGRSEFVVIAHHLLCDGGSLMILMRDILRSLNGLPVAEAPIRLLAHSDLPKHPALALPMRIMARATNRRWQKSGRVFPFEDLAAMWRRYAETNANTLCIRQLDGRVVARLKEIAHDSGVTINSLICAAFLAGREKGESVGVAVDIRPQGYAGMGNYATAITVTAGYDPGISLQEAAKELHANIHRKLESPKDKYFLYEFMRALAPTLTDAIYFSRYAGYQNPVSEAVCKMCGYTDAPAGISLSNLKEIEMPDDPAWETRYTGLYFVPPYMPNARAGIGVSTFRDTMTLTLHTGQGDRAEREIARFHAACDRLQGA